VNKNKKEKKIFFLLQQMIIK